MWSEDQADQPTFDSRLFHSGTFFTASTQQAVTWNVENDNYRQIAGLKL